MTKSTVNKAAAAGSGAKPTRVPHRRIACALARHARFSERAITLFKRAEAELNSALQLQPALGKPIMLPGGRIVMIVDQFQDKNSAFSAKVFHRFQVVDWKEPKTAKVGVESVA